jgi:hypothetical protein
MHHRDASGSLSLQVPRAGHSRPLLLDSTFFARPKGACCLPPSALWEAPWVVSDADLAGVWVLALFLKLLRHTVVSF